MNLESPPRQGAGLDSSPRAAASDAPGAGGKRVRLSLFAGLGSPGAGRAAAEQAGAAPAESDDPHPAWLFLLLCVIAFFLLEWSGNGFLGGRGRGAAVDVYVPLSLFAGGAVEPAPLALQAGEAEQPAAAALPRRPQQQQQQQQRQRFAPASPPSQAAVTFWFIWSTSLREWHWMPLAVVESVFVHHPRARVRFLSMVMPLDYFACVAAAGFDIAVERYDLRALAQGTVLANFVDSGRLNESAHFRYAHESDLLRLVVLSRHGGIYLDTDLLLLQPLDGAVLDNPVLGVEYYNDPMRESKTYGGIRLNNAFMGFPEPGSPYLDWIMQRVEASYNPKEWAAIGPDLITEAYSAMAPEVQDTFHLVPPRGLYPLHWALAHSVLNPDRTQVDREWPPGVRNESYGIHLYNSNSWRYEGGS
jgi:lactosylceramide 4-alpha-galactosyltransferase